MKYKYCLIVLFLWKSLFSYSQPVPPGTEVQELVKIMQVYENAPNLSFDIRLTFADSLTWQTLTDSMLVTCKMSYGKSLVSNSVFEFLKGNQYQVYVDKEDSLVFAMQRQADETVLKAPFLDSLFRAVNVDSMWIFNINDSNWVFRATFKPGSFYSLYEMKYDPRTGLIHYITYHVQNTAGAYNVPQDHIICAFVYMTNYSDAELDQALFNEHRYFYRLNGSLFLQPAWEDYELETF